jgi:hypothetical protein
VTAHASWSFDESLNRQRAAGSDDDDGVNLEGAHDFRGSRGQLGEPAFEKSTLRFEASERERTLVRSSGVRGSAQTAAEFCSG